MEGGGVTFQRFAEQNVFVPEFVNILHKFWYLKLQLKMIFLKKTTKNLK